MNLKKTQEKLNVAIDDFLSKNIENKNSYQIKIFKQIWKNTSGGFQDIGGDSIVEEPTIVFYDLFKSSKAFIYFNGKFAYQTNITKTFFEDLSNERILGLEDAKKYYLAVED